MVLSEYWANTVACNVRRLLAGWGQSVPDTQKEELTAVAVAAVLSIACGRVPCERLRGASGT